MLGVIPNVITHKLNANLTSHSVIQKKRNFFLDRAQAINEEVTKLLEAKFICKVDYPKWLANVILVKRPMENGEFVLITLI